MDTYISSVQQWGRKRIPYGMTNFEAIMREECYYVDKTRFIERIEDANNVFLFSRPRRFGKSLLLNILYRYYDINSAEMFDDIFGKLYIGQHPTPLRNHYGVLQLNFSMVNGTLTDYHKSLDDHCRNRISAFLSAYKDRLGADAQERVMAVRGCSNQLDKLCECCVEAHLPVYLIIDEYDHFTNQVLASSDDLIDYRAQTHGTGYFRTLFNTIKGCTTTAIARVFIAGVAPVTMDDLSSGFNIGSNYSLSPEFNEMLGFTEGEVRAMLDYYGSVVKFNHTTDELIAVMKPYYDNYCFAKECYGDTTMYNSCMVLYFLDNYLQYRCRVPKDMIESNIRVDYEKLRMFIRKDKEFVHDASVVQSIVNNGFITANIRRDFPAERITVTDNFVSLLYYFGMLTFAGTHRGSVKLAVPNEVVREQMYEYLLATYRAGGVDYRPYEFEALEAPMAYDALWKPYFQYIADCIHTFASQRDKQKGEAFVHGFTLALASQNRFYRPISELDTQGGYADVFLRPRTEVFTDMEHSYLIELKYAKSGETDADIARKRAEAEAQIARYAQTDAVREGVSTTRLHALVVLFRGTEMVVCEEIAL